MIEDSELSLVVFLLTALVIGRKFFSITAKLAPAAVHREYRMERLSSRSAMSALVRKEAKRYFSSGVYVSNTIIGAVLTVVIAVALAFVSPSELLAKAGNIPVNINADAVLPFLFGMCICMMSITASAAESATAGMTNPKTAQRVSPTADNLPQHL